MSNYTDIFQQLGLAKNEARIYETLLRHGETSVSNIAKKSNVHRRNVYDSLDRLIEKGIVFEIIASKENLYQAVDPKKLSELLEQKKKLLDGIMPELNELYRSVPHQEEVYIYRGIEGWKNYMRDIIRVGEDFYCIGAKGAWMDPRAMDFFPTFIEQAKKKKIGYYHLFDYEVKEQCHPILEHVGQEYKILPKGYSAPASVDIFGPQVNILSSIKVGGFDEEFAFTVIVNPQIADAFRLWFKMMWDFCP